MSKEYSLRLIPNFIQYNDENNEEFNEIKKLYYDTGDTTLFNTISFMLLVLAKTFKVLKYNSLLERFNSLIDEYNELVDEYNNLI